MVRFLEYMGGSLLIFGATGLLIALLVVLVYIIEEKLND